jgi:hypothetical protein
MHSNCPYRCTVVLFVFQDLVYEFRCCIVYIYILTATEAPLGGGLEIAPWNRRWQICKVSLFIVNYKFWDVVAITLAERMTSIRFQAHHVEHAATVAGTWVMAALSNVVSSYRIRIACTGDRTAHMRLNSHAQPRKRALTAGLPLCSEAKMSAYLHICADPSDQTVRCTTSTVLLTTGIPSGTDGRGLFFKFIGDTKSERAKI